MHKILIIFVVGLLFAACQDQKIGFLTTKFAQYNPDSMIITAKSEVMDPSRLEFNIPWLSQPMEGIEGTAPILISIEDVKSDANVGLGQLKEHISVRGNGVIEVDLDHEIPSGSYLISLKATNGDNTSIIPDIFTLVVE